LKTFLISGCLIYPVENTCFDKLLWTNKLYIAESLSAEAWAKGYPDSKIKYEFAKYIANFEWLSTWLGNHFIFILKKLSVIFFILLCITIYISQGGNKFKANKGFKIILYYNLIFCIIWFLNFPVYRFGSGILISTTILIIICFQKNLNLINFSKIIKISASVLILIMCSKSANRVIDNIKINQLSNPWINIYSDNYKKKIKYKKIYYSNNKKKFYYSPENSEICYYSPAPCTHLVDENLHYKEINSYSLILKNY